VQQLYRVAALVQTSVLGLDEYLEEMDNADQRLEIGTESVQYYV
jgi:hypothetical protein